MEGLKGLDDVAFVRFASVYKNFSAADDFRSFLTELRRGWRQPTLATTTDLGCRPVTPLRWLGQRANR